MTAMDFCSDLEQVSSNFLDMIENDINGQLMEMENLNSDKLGEFMFNNDQCQDGLSNSHLDFDQDSDLNNINLFQNLHWNDISKVPQSLIDASSEIENNNPNLLVNPQSVLPMHSSSQPTQATQNVQNTNQVNVVRHGVPVKINGQDAILTSTQHPQIQYVTLQNTGSDSTQIGYTVQPVTLGQQQIHNLQTSLSGSPSQSSPVLVEHLQNGLHNNSQINTVCQLNQQLEKVYPKPVYSYSCLIAMALKNSKTGNLPVSEIYTFMIENFPYFKTAPDGWKNSVRHNLSLNKCFAKVESVRTGNAHTRKGCLWALNPAKVEKMEDEIVKWRKKDPESVKHSMAKPENLELIEQGKAGPPKEHSYPSSVPHSPVVKSEVVQLPTTPVKQEIIPITTGSARKAIPRREATVTVHLKTEPQNNFTDLKDLGVLQSSLNFDPALSDLALNNGLWDDDLNSELSLNLISSLPQSIIGTPTGLVQTNPTLGTATQYHGNITYTTSHVTSLSNHGDTTPTKIFPQTPSKLYPQTPTRIVIT